MSLLSMPELQSYQAWQDATCQQIKDASSEHAFYWLLDSCAHDDLPGLLWRLESEPQAWPLYMNTYLQETLHAGPFFLPHRPDSEIARWIFSEAATKPLGCLLEIESTSTRATFEHLQNLVECIAPDGEESIFRVYDPRIIYGVSTFKYEAMQSFITGPILHWNAWEPGRCVPVRLGTGKDDGQRCMEPALLTEAFIEHIWDEACVHSTIGSLGREPGMQLRAMPLSKAYTLVEYVYRTIAQYGYHDRVSLAYGTSVTVRLGLDIWQQPDVCEAFAGRPVNAPIDEVFDSIGI